MGTDPHEPPAPDDATELALGIDLGTTNTVAAVVSAGHLVLIDDGHGHRLHPSVVGIKPSGELVVGLPARLRRIVDPTNTVFSSKRIIGQAFHSPPVQEALRHLPYRVEPGDNDEPVVATRGGPLSVIDIGACVLRHVRDLAERQLGRPIARCVVTVPANFNDGQREATRRAAELAGMEVLRILNEPTAAAFAYGFSRPAEQRVVVFDLGGGTFDVTLLSLERAMFRVLATGGDPFLGGDDMDRALADVLVRQFLEEQRVDLREHPESMARLLIACEQIKARLSKEDKVEGTISELAYGEGGKPLPLSFQVSRARFEELIEPLVARAMAKCEQVLLNAEVQCEHIDEVILVGGATRVPMVGTRVAQWFRRAPRAGINPMEVVAAGAALQAAMLLAPPGAPAGPLLMDVTSHALGVATAGGFSDILVDTNSPIPTERARVFTTSHDGQTEVAIRVSQGDDKRFDKNTLLGELRLEGLRPAPRGQVRIEVSFLVDADGILQVSARDLETGRVERATLRVLGVGRS